MASDQVGQTQCHSRWEEEAAFFDRVADERAISVSPIDAFTLQRYTGRKLRKRFKEEFRFGVLGDLRGKRVLDVGCGEGSNSLTLAFLGAQVTGIDISPRSIELARRRAEVNGLTNTPRFICSPLEKAEMRPAHFDIVWGDSILHHLIDDLEIVLQRLTLWAKPGAMMLFCEPVNLNNILRRLRLRLPVKTEATPGERPLEAPELEIAERFLPDMQIRPYSLFGRFTRFVLPGNNYERSTLQRRALVNALACADYALLSLPFIRSMAGYAVLYGHCPKMDAFATAVSESRPS